MTTLRVVSAGNIHLGCGKEWYANSSDENFKIEVAICVYHLEMWNVSRSNINSCFCMVKAFWSMKIDIL